MKNIQYNTCITLIFRSKEAVNDWLYNKLDDCVVIKCIYTVGDTLAGMVDRRETLDFYRRTTDFSDLE